MCREEIDCADGTNDTFCSLNKPYQCYNGTLSQKASICGCPASLEKDGDTCYDPFPTDATKIYAWKYRGKPYSVSLPVSSKLNTYYYDNFDMYYTGRQSDFYLKYINDPFQYSLFDSLSSQVQEKDNDTKLMTIMAYAQNVPYSPLYSVKLKPPYETIYENEGVCADKTILGAALAKNLGYGVALFDFIDENHLALGIKCPQELSNYDSGYCFLEMTMPCGRLTDNNGIYTDGTKLTGRVNTIPISDGKSLSYSTVIKDINERKEYENIPIMESDIIAQESEASRAGDISRYNELVNEYNEYVKKFNAYNSCD
jgi:hypothetical protein